MSRMFLVVSACTCALFFFCLSDPDQVIVYTSVDQVYSEPVLKVFERKSGIKVKALYDVEASKTVGLVNRLLAEKDRPYADVFWNSEAGRTIQLKKAGVLQPYISINSGVFPTSVKDVEGYWTGFAARARVLIYNTKLVADSAAPRSIFDFCAPQWRRKAAIAYPLFGTTATHVAALYEQLGPDSTERFLKGLVANGILVVDGNAVSRDMVAEGKIPAGFTDTDDAMEALGRGDPIKIVFPDSGGIGTLLIPNTVALIKNCLHKDAGKKLIDFLLSAEAENLLVSLKSAQIPLRPDSKRAEGFPAIQSIRIMQADYGKIASHFEAAALFCRTLFVR
jgi:iron(III) transport system substrate-binding protein